jgi:parallel beta-helix repeat protein
VGFTEKSWQQGVLGGTPLSAPALIDMEDRLSTYTDALMTTAKKHGAIGDGIADDTVALQAAIDSVTATSGGVVYLQPGTYLFTTLTLRDNLHLVGAGRGSTVLKTSGPASAQSALLLGSGRVGIVIEHLTIDGNNHANAACGVYITGSGTDKNSALRNCRVTNFTTTNGFSPVGQACGIYSWTADSIVVESNEFVNNNYDVYMDSPGSDCRVINNRIWSTGGHTGRLIGIMMRSNSNIESGALVSGNTVENVKTDAGGIGLYGHGINLSGVRNVRVLGNSCEDCTCAGIHVGGGCFGAKVKGNHCFNCAQTIAAPIYVELNIGDSNTTVGIDGRYAGCIIEDNTIDTSFTYGISISYSAGSIVKHNIITKARFEGIFCDSDRVQILGNVVYNNYTGNLSPSPTSVPNVQAQIRITTGQYCIVRDNQVFGTSTSQADNAIAVGDGNHIVEGNNTDGSGFPGYFGGAGIYSVNRNTNFINDDGSNIATYGGTSTIAVVASTATVSPPNRSRFIQVTGTANITSIVGSWPGRIITLIFTGTAGGTGVTAGSNLKMPSNFVYTPNDTITFVGDGTNWYEMCRSVNP